MRKLTIARRLAAGVGSMMLLFLLAGVILDASVRKIDESVEHVRSNEEPASSAAYEMETSVMETSLGIHRYLNSGTQEDRNEVQYSAKNFESSMSRYMRPVETPEERAAGEKADSPHDDLKKLCARLMDERDEQTNLIAKTSDNFDEKLQAGVNTTDPEVSEKLQSTIRLETKAVNTWFEAYLVKPKDKYRKRLSTSAEDFRNELQDFESLNLTGEERDLADEMGARFQRNRKLVNQATAVDDSIRSGNNRFTGLVRGIENVLDGKIKVLTRKNLESAELQTNLTLVRTRRVLLGIPLIGLLIAGATWYLTSRSIVRPLRRLIDGARRIGQGDLAHRIEVSGRAEIRNLTNAFNEMAERRQLSENEVHRLNEDLEARVRERTEQLVRSENRYRAVVESATEGIYIFDPATGRIRESNRAYQRLIGYTAEELTDMTVYDVVAHDRESVNRYIRETVVRDSHLLGERRYRRKDGTFVDVEVGTVMITLGEKKLLCAIVRDITDHKRAEEKLRESKNSLAAAQRIAHLGNFEHGINDDTSLWSDELYEIFGLSPHTFSPTYRRLMQCVHPEDRRFLRRKIREILRGEESGETECRIIRPDRETRNLHIRYEVIRNESRNPVRLVGTAQDITERKQAETRLRETENRFRTLVEQTPAITYIDAMDENSTAIYMSPQVEEMLGYTPEEWISNGELWADSLHPEDRERVLREHRRTNETLDPFSMEYRMISRDGRIVWVRDEAVAVRSETEDVMCWQGILTDITGRRQIEKEAREWANYSRNLFDISLDALFTMDAEGKIQDANTSMSAIAGIPKEDLIGQNIFDFLPDADLDREEFEDTLSRGYTQNYSSTIRASDGRRIPVVLNATVLRNEAGEITGIFASIRDMTELNRLVQDMEHIALHDSLTGLPNRTLLFDRLDQALIRARREERCIGMLFVDLDRFKIVNDSLGHRAGDELLKASAARLRECLRSGDTLARIGGDEFVALLEHISGAGEAALIASRISASLKHPFEIDGHEVTVDVSIGIAIAEERDGAESLLQKADLAMYSAKRNRKSGYEVFDPEMNDRAQKRLRLENDLRKAIERGELRVYYQPKVNIQNDHLHGFEALVRWESPKRGLVSPVEFISLAEETGLLIPMGRFVLRETCRQAKLWQDYYPWEKPPVVAINVSANQLRRTDIVEEVELALKGSKLPAQNLCIEITESVLMEDVESNMTSLLRLKALGVKLAIDDFGTGYSSLSYLKRFPVDIIKIDRSFVNRMEYDSDSATIVESMITLSHTLGLEVVAEGVETYEQLRLLRDLDCDLAQGFYFGHPLPAPSTNELLAGVLLRGEGLISSE